MTVRVCILCYTCTFLMFFVYELAFIFILPQLHDQRSFIPKVLVLGLFEMVELGLKYISLIFNLVISVDMIRM